MHLKLRWWKKTKFLTFHSDRILLAVYDPPSLALSPSLLWHSLNCSYSLCSFSLSLVRCLGNKIFAFLLSSCLHFLAVIPDGGENYLWRQGDMAGRNNNVANRTSSDSLRGPHPSITPDALLAMCSTHSPHYCKWLLKQAGELKACQFHKSHWSRN